jgi:Ca2+-binding EF-hand superfamily protein
MADRDLSEDEVADLKEAFAMFDINGDGMSQQQEDSQSMFFDSEFRIYCSATPVLRVE